MEKVALIPAYQPDGKLVHIVQSLVNLKFKVFVVNDGSNNVDSIKVLQEISKFCELINLTQNSGKGAAIKAGLNKIRSLKLTESYIVTLDSDGQHLPKDAERVLEKLIKGDSDIVLGVRNFFKNRIPFRSFFGNLMTAFLLFGLNKRMLLDTQTGLRAFRFDLIEEMMQVSETNYDWEFAVLSKFLAGNRKISTCKITTIYEPGNPSSHFSKITDSARIYFVFLKYFFSNMLAITVEYMLFYLLITFNSSIFLALSFSRISSLTIHFIAQKKFTFRNNSKAKIHQVLAYLSLALFNYVISLTVLISVNSYFTSALFLKLIIDLILSVFTFTVLYKLFSLK